MRPLKIISMALVFNLSACTSQADPAISKSYSYFSIDGTTGAQIEHELFSHGPKLAQTGTRHAGMTRVELGGSVTYAQSPTNCKIAAVNVKLHTKITLPRWKNRKQADVKTATLWDTLSADIKRHEERHAEIARQYARKLDKALKSLRPRKTCEQLQAKVDAINKKIVAEHAADQQRFDRIEAASYQRRMQRMIKFRMEKLKKHN